MTVGYDCALGSVARGWLVEGLGLDLELEGFDGSWGRARGECGPSGWSLFLRGNGRLGFGVGLAGATEVLSGTGVWSGLRIDVGVILGRRICLLVLCRFEVGGLRTGLVSRRRVLEVLSVVGILGGVFVGEAARGG